MTKEYASRWARPASRGSSRASPWSGWSPKPPPFTRAWPAQATERTLQIARRLIESARIHHPEVTQREVVLHRIVRVEAAQRRRDVLRHHPSWTGIARQTKAPADPNHVGVQRDDEFGGRHAGPDPKVERVSTNHPAEKEIQPLAGAAG